MIRDYFEYLFQIFAVRLEKDSSSLVYSYMVLRANEATDLTKHLDLEFRAPGRIIKKAFGVALLRQGEIFE